MLDAFKVDTELLYASDCRIGISIRPAATTTLSFLSERAKRNILGVNAAHVFNLEVKRTKGLRRSRCKARHFLISIPVKTNATAGSRAAHRIDAKGQSRTYSAIRSLRNISG